MDIAAWSGVFVSFVLVVLWAFAKAFLKNVEADAMRIFSVTHDELRHHRDAAWARMRVTFIELACRAERLERAQQCLQRSTGPEAARYRAKIRRAIAELRSMEFAHAYETAWHAGFRKEMVAEFPPAERLMDFFPQEARWHIAREITPRNVCSWCSVKFDGAPAFAPKEAEPEHV